MSYEDYKWYLKAIEALWTIDVLTDHQHDLEMNTTTITPSKHQVRVSGWPYGAPTPDGYYAKCSCGWAGTVHGRETDASEDGSSHQMMYAWKSRKTPTELVLWNQAVAVLRENKYQVTQSSRNYATALSRVGLGSPADEIDNVNPSCDCDYCVIHRGEIAEQEYEKYEQLDAYRNFRDEQLRGGGAWE